MQNGRKVLFYGIVSIIACVLIICIFMDIKKEKANVTTSADITVAGEITKNTDNHVEEPSTDTKTTRIKLDEATLTQKLSELRVTYADGSYWNKTGVACNHDTNGTKDCNSYTCKSNAIYPYTVAGRQSVGFAGMVNDYIYGVEAEAYMYKEYSDIQVGDIARISNDTHSAIIIEKKDDYVLVVECNRDGLDCKVEWGRKVNKAELVGAWYIGRR